MGGGGGGAGAGSSQLRVAVSLEGLREKKFMVVELRTYI